MTRKTQLYFYQFSHITHRSWDKQAAQQLGYLFEWIITHLFWLILDLSWKSPPHMYFPTENVCARTILLSTWIIPWVKAIPFKRMKGQVSRIIVCFPSIRGISYKEKGAYFFLRPRPSVWYFYFRGSPPHPWIFIWLLPFFAYYVE